MRAVADVHQAEEDEGDEPEQEREAQDNFTAVQMDRRATAEEEGCGDDREGDQHIARGDDTKPPHQRDL